MQVDRERLQSKIAYIREQETAIQSLLSARSKEEILGDPWLVRGLKYAMQTAIEALIDISYHVAARVFRHAAADARDALRVLRENGLIGEEDLERYTSMVGFRNRVVHGYQQVSAERVYELASRELGDLERFIEQVLPLLEKD